MARSRQWGLAAAVLVSLGAHLLVGAILIRARETPPAPGAPTVIDLQLVSPPKPPSPSAAGRGARETSPRARPAPPHTPSPVGPVPSPPSAVAAGDPEALRRALRGRLGCRPGGAIALSPEEQRRCEDRDAAAFADLRAAPVPKYDLSKGGRLAKDDTPYLARKPKKGCKLMAGGREAPSGDEGAVAGIGCAWSF